MHYINYCTINLGDFQENPPNGNDTFKEERYTHILVSLKATWYTATYPLTDLGWGQEFIGSNLYSSDKLSRHLKMQTMIHIEPYRKPSTPATNIIFFALHVEICIKLLGLKTSHINNVKTHQGTYVLSTCIHIHIHKKKTLTNSVVWNQIYQTPISPEKNVTAYIINS